MPAKTAPHPNQTIVPLSMRDRRKERGGGGGISGATASLLSHEREGLRPALVKRGCADATAWTVSGPAQ